MMLPDVFRRNMVDVHGLEGEAWLQRLPTIVQTCEQRWHVSAGQPYANLSYNLILEAKNVQGADLVLKLGVPTGEFRSESAALQIYDGRGIVRLFEWDESLGAMLLERVTPGDSLHSVEDPTLAVDLYTEVHLKLRRPAPNDDRFATVGDWAQGFERLRRSFSGSTGPFPTNLVEDAEKLYPELINTTEQPQLLHGDLHHANILMGEEGVWTAIDPKGVIGDPAYDTISFLLNLPQKQLESVAALGETIAAICAGTGYDKARVKAWGFCHAMLSAWWTYDSHGHGWEAGVEIAKRFRSL